MIDDFNVVPHDVEQADEVIEAGPLPEVDSELASLRVEHEALLDLHRDLVGRYRAALLASDATIAPDLVSGDTAEEVEASFETARRVVSGIRESLRREQMAVVPAGAPGRNGMGPTSAYDKIRSGLARLAAS